MNEERNGIKDKIKSDFKKMIKNISITGIVVAIIIFLLVMVYVVLKDDFEKITRTDSTYATVVNSDGSIKYVKTTKDDEGNKIEEEVEIEDILADLEDSLRFYIGGTDEEYAERLEYLINAETVTTMPYIDGGSSEKLNGRIKFYRYQDGDEITTADLKEKNRLKFMNFDKFQELVDARDKSVYENFTINAKGEVIIACGSEEFRTISTGIEGTEKEKYLTLEKVKEESGEDKYTGDYKNGFSMSDFEMYTVPINYKSSVEPYIMPTNLLYALLVQTKDINFVKSLAELAYETEIAVGIFDKTSTINTNKIYTYNKLVDFDITTSLKFNNSNLVNISDSGKNIRLTVQDIKKTPYSYIQTGCHIETKEDGQAQHEIIYLVERVRI